jgi:hypothetical protein
MLAAGLDALWEGLIEVSPYLNREPRILRDACQAARRNDDGRRCPTCSVRIFCEGQASRADRPLPDAASR